MQTIKIRYTTLYSFGIAGIMIVILGVVILLKMPQPSYSQTCMTRQQVSSDTTRCLYIIDSTVYKKGSRSSPHKGHPCGTDVTTIIPSFHAATASKYLTPNLVGTICAGPTPTTIPTPTVPKVPTATIGPTQVVQPTTPPTGVPTTPPTPLPTAIVPTATLAPTQVPAAGSSLLAITLRLHGIGSGGDNVVSPANGNMTPLSPQRVTTVTLYSTTGSIVMGVQGVVTYNSSDGTFKGTMDLGTALQTGFYTVKIVTHPFLRHLVPQIVSITKGTTTMVPIATLINGDVNDDNHLDSLDYNMVLDCFSDLLPAKNCSTAGKKQATDMNDDGNVNQVDYNLFVRELSVQIGN